MLKLTRIIFLTFSYLILTIPVNSQNIDLPSIYLLNDQDEKVSLKSITEQGNRFILKVILYPGSKNTYNYDEYKDLLIKNDVQIINVIAVTERQIPFVKEKIAALKKRYITNKNIKFYYDVYQRVNKNAEFRNISKLYSSYPNFRRNVFPGVTTFDNDGNCFFTNSSNAPVNGIEGLVGTFFQEDYYNKQFIHGIEVLGKRENGKFLTLSSNYSYNVRNHILQWNDKKVLWEKAYPESKYKLEDVIITKEGTILAGGIFYTSPNSKEYTKGYATMKNGEWIPNLKFGAERKFQKFKIDNKGQIYFQHFENQTWSINIWDGESWINHPFPRISGDFWRSSEDLFLFKGDFKNPKKKELEQEVEKLLQEGKINEGVIKRQILENSTGVATWEKGEFTYYLDFELNDGSKWYFSKIGPCHIGPNGDPIISGKSLVIPQVNVVIQKHGEKWEKQDSIWFSALIEARNSQLAKEDNSNEFLKTRIQALKDSNLGIEIVSFFVDVEGNHFFTAHIEGVKEKTWSICQYKNGKWEVVKFGLKGGANRTLTFLPGEKIILTSESYLDSLDKHLSKPIFIPYL